MCVCFFSVLLPHHHRTKDVIKSISWDFREQILWLKLLIRWKTSCLWKTNLFGAGAAREQGARLVLCTRDWRHVATHTRTQLLFPVFALHGCECNHFSWAFSAMVS